jgi:hypothetical protein
VFCLRFVVHNGVNINVSEVKFTLFTEAALDNSLCTRCAYLALVPSFMQFLTSLIMSALTDDRS